MHGSSHPPRTRLRDASARGELDIERALAEVTAYVQPVVSVRERGVRLVEALARGQDVAGRTRLPAELFAEATRGGYMGELGERCRRQAFAAYRLVQAQQELAPMLSINTDSALVLEGAAGAEQLVNEALENGVAPSRVALEILESALPDVQKLEEFCRAAKRAGFLVALDDIGTGYSNLERIPRLEPDILKIDRQLVHGMSESYHRREVFRSLLQLAHQIGALAIAEGVETEGDVLTALSLGCDLFQGYYFGHPIDVRAGRPLCDFGRLREAGDQFRADAKRRLNERRSRQRRSEQAMRALVTTLKETTEAHLPDVLRDALQSMPFVEALYVLDERGVQVTDTIHRAVSSRQGGLFRPSTAGTDQSLKQYFFMLHAGLERFTSDPYISMASGNFCITMSRLFKNVLGRDYVLCCDLMVPRQGL